MSVAESTDWDQWDRYRFPDVFARNLSARTITCNVGKIKWQVKPKAESFVPWRVAVSDGFTRAWARQELLVSLDEDFESPITELPIGEDSGSVFFRPKVVRQTVPQATTVVQHNFNRDGPVFVAAYSLDRLIQWEGFIVDIIDRDTCSISFESPTTFEATIF